MPNISISERLLRLPIPLILAIFAAIWQISIINLSNIDHHACLENASNATIGLAPSVAQIGEMSIKDLLSTWFNSFETIDVFIVPFLLLAFVPLFLSVYRAQERNLLKRYYWATLILLCIVVLGTGSPESLHDCDRKGSDAAILIFPMQFLYLLAAFALQTGARVLATSGKTN